MEWIKCSDRMPEIGANEWRTPLPVIVSCGIGAVPAYYGFTWNEGEKYYGFMESLRYGNDRGECPDEDECRLIKNVTHWMPLPAPPAE
ncbi:DUF551 domain-containing protein [Cronobacter dublinensis]|uniref:DUF551 domain-containing protein n=1 Tax=Cronobacter dublinensis TaxID=413497 RepID=UPI00289428C4|nr:DUF551 domain-containing protein [Cronobacter dublinensis]MDT3605980.1 DUF551 domain-containing protein [Cronobacter dublinensis]